uniref:melanoma-associated antigen B10-like n=1 Tax=Jaculus jaculus TaxID=51337 RepID=UPI001E1B4D03|nr:melanoma-associated antigen B10-like [Jaculus jaculus]
MYRVQKSNRYVRARQSRKHLVVSPSTVSDEDEYPLSSFAKFKDVCYFSLPELYKISHGYTRTSISTTTAVDTSYTRSSKGKYKKGKNKKRSSRGPKAAENFHIGPVSDSVLLLVHLLLYRYERRESFTRAEMLECTIENERQNFPKILKTVSDCLEFVFGLDLKPLGPTNCTYIVTNKLGPYAETGLSSGLLLTVLGIIFISGNCATEKQVWEGLHKVGVYDRKNHYIFGDIGKLLTEDLVEKLYLKYRQVPNSDPPLYVFLWGPRAYVESSKMQVLEFYCRIHKTTPRAYPSCYKQALIHDKQIAQELMKGKTRAARIRERCKAAYSNCTPPAQI